MKVVEFLIKFFAVLILIAVFIYWFGLSGILNHEEIHQRIFSDYGFESTIEINYKTLSGVVTPLGNGNCNDFCLTQHRFNDIVFFNFTILIFNLWAIFGVYFICKLLFRKY